MALDKGLSEQQRSDEKALDALLEQIPRSRIFVQKGDKVTMRSWFKLVSRLDEWLDEFHTELLVLVLVGLEMGVWAAGDELPIWGRAPLRQRAALQPNEDPASLRAQYKNALHCAAMILGDELAAGHWRLMVEVARPLWTAFVAAEKMMTNAEGVRSYSMGLATGLFSVVLNRTWSVLRSPAKLSTMGLTTGEETANLPGIKGKGFAPWPQSQAEEHGAEMELALELWTLTWRLVGNLAACTGQYSDGYPGHLVTLLSEKAPTRLAGLERLKHTWLVLQEAEKRSLENLCVRGLLRSVVWVTNVPIRELIIAAAEQEFQRIPQDHLEVVRAIFEGLGHTGPRASVSCLYHFAKHCQGRRARETGGQEWKLTPCPA